MASEYDAEFALLLDRRVRRWSTARSSIVGFPNHGGPSVGGTTSHLPNQHSLLSGIAQSSTENGDNGSSPLQIEAIRLPIGAPREIPVFKNHPWGNRPAPAQRPITVIDEASV